MGTMGNMAKRTRGTGKEKVYNFIVGFIQENCYSPSIREICAGTGLSSPSSVHSHLAVLKMMGQIEMEENIPRSIRLTGYGKANGALAEIEVAYDKPEPVLYRERANAGGLGGIHFCFGKHAFISDESEDYEFYILGSNCGNDVWIIQDMDGNIRVWDNASDELFFGKESEYVYERTDKGEYVPVAV